MNKAQLVHYWQHLPWKEINQKAYLELPRAVFFLLVILIAYSLAQLTWSFFSENEVVSQKSTTVKRTPAQVQDTASSFAVVSSYHLFGKVSQNPTNQPQVIDAPDTRLRLDLKGVFASTQADEALAIISSSKDKDKTYRIGDKVIGGAILHAVYEDRVILKRNGQLETLRLPKPKVDSDAFYQPQVGTLPATQTVHSGSSKQQRLRQIKETLLKDPAKIWQQVRINPVMKNGKVKGYTLAHNDQALMKQLNIRKTDIITKINGESLSDPATLYGLMNTLSDQSSLELTIERNGQQQLVQLTF